MLNKENQQTAASSATDTAASTTTKTITENLDIQQALSSESILLECLDDLLKQHWNLGQNILLCWRLDTDGIQVLPAPHYFLGRFSASLGDCAPVDRLDALNGSFIRELISGSRLLSAEDFDGAVSRLRLEPVKVKLPAALSADSDTVAAVDSLIQRYSINYVKSRAVLLFDIVDFSLVSSFEQTSQLNSLSYSLNSAHSKLLKRNIDINFSRTTTGDGYYVWHQHDSPRANLELFEFMILVVADNALAQMAAAGASSGQVVPKIRTGFHIGSHFEFFQVEGLSPGMNSFIVGDVTIELSRMLDLAGTGQIFIGDFDTVVPTSSREEAYLIAADSQRFVERAVKQMDGLTGTTLSDETIESIHCFLSGESGASGGQTVRRFRITDKHGRSRNVYNLRINIRTANRPVMLGLHDSELPKKHTRRKADVRGNQRTKAFQGLRSKPSASIAVFED
ncbi:hypothetical protein [Oceanicoccus sagamiensis]|uniref:hypothetical protein n=1 Tax=Oceanicoccus sagamiensis TaxID=716816 RepID=UPI000A26BFF7|nr:hypothetical protein [Oceanicoccus sagamiensis]